MKVPSWTSLVTFALGIGLCWYFMRSCNEPDQNAIDTIKSLTHVNDSIVKRIKIVSIHDDSLSAAKKIGDSAYKHTVDSQKIVISKLERKVKVTWDSIGVLYAQVKTLYLDHDTLGLIEAYDDLGAQLAEANRQIKEMKDARDSTDATMVAEISRLNGFVDQLQTEIKELKILLVQCTDNASQLAKTGLKEAKKAKIAALISKIGVGISGILAILLLTHK